MDFHVLKWNQKLLLRVETHSSSPLFLFSPGFHSKFIPHYPTFSYTPQGILAVAYLSFSPTAVKTPEGKIGTRPCVFLVRSSHAGTQMRAEWRLKSNWCSALQPWALRGCGCQGEGHLFQIYTKNFYRLWAAPIGNTCFNSTTFFTASNTVPNKLEGGGSTESTSKTTIFVLWNIFRWREKKSRCIGDYCRINACVSPPPSNSHVEN